MNVNSVIISVTQEHLPEVLAAERACFADPWSKDSLAHEIGAPRTEFFAAMEVGRVVGFCILKKILDEGEIYNIAVLPEKRRRGIADCLLREVACRSRDLSFIHLEVRATNLPAIALYEKHGFKKVGRRRGYYKNPVEDAILMTKALAEYRIGDKTGGGREEEHAHIIH